MTDLHDLSGPSLPPAGGGKPRRLVVILHGYGADGHDLIALAPAWAPVLPDTEFIAPHAPYPVPWGGPGRQWWGLEDRSPAALWAGVQVAGPILDSWLDRQLAARGLTDADLALVGFSQGSMMALHVGLRRAHACAGVIGYSGALVNPAAAVTDVCSRPPVLLVHGSADEVVPFAAMAQAEAGLRAAGVPVEAYGRPGLGHGVDQEGLVLGLRFLQRAFAPAGV